MGNLTSQLPTIFCILKSRNLAGNPSFCTTRAYFLAASRDCSSLKEEQKGKAALISAFLCSQDGSQFRATTMLICAPEKHTLLLKIASLYPQNHFSELKGKRHFVIHFLVVCLSTLEHVAWNPGVPLFRGFCLSSLQQLLRADPRGRRQTPVQSSS